MNNADLYWLAGLLEGEGSFLSGPPSKPNRTRISLQMTDRDVVERAAAILGSRMCVARSRQEAHHKGSYITMISYQRARDWMARLRPLMGERRQSQIDRALTSHDPSLIARKRRLSADDVREIRRRSRSERTNHLANEFGIAESSARRVITRQTYQDIL